VRHLRIHVRSLLNKVDVVDLYELMDASYRHTAALLAML
jgi:hypothetical protein